MDDERGATRSGPTAASWLRHLRYATCGVLALCAYLGAGELLRRGGASQALLAWLPFALAVGVQYLLQRQWVFCDHRHMLASLPRHLAMTGLGLAINVLTLNLLAGHVSLAVAQLAATAVIVTSNAMLAYGWVFASRGSLSAPSPSSLPPRSRPRAAPAAARHPP